MQCNGYNAEGEIAIYQEKHLAQQVTRCPCRPYTGNLCSSADVFHEHKGRCNGALVLPLVPGYECSCKPARKASSLKHVWKSWLNRYLEGWHCNWKELVRGSSCCAVHYQLYTVYMSEFELEYETWWWRKDCMGAYSINQSMFHNCGCVYIHDISSLGSYV